MPVTLSLVVPCYNPPPGWSEQLAEQFVAFRERSGCEEVKLVLVNDGSGRGVGPDQVRLIENRVGIFEFISYPTNRGKGFALRRGVAVTDSDLVLFTDVDFPYTLESMLSVEAALLREGGIATGFRQPNYYLQTPRFRKWLSRSFRWVLRTFLGLKSLDTQCGLKGFDRQGKEVFLETTIDRYLFDLEFLLKARSRVRITNVPVVLRPNISFSSVGLNILLNEGFNFLRILLRK